MARACHSGSELWHSTVLKFHFYRNGGSKKQACISPCVFLSHQLPRKKRSTCFLLISLKNIFYTLDSRTTEEAKKIKSPGIFNLSLSAARNEGKKLLRNSMSFLSKSTQRLVLNILTWVNIYCSLLYIYLLVLLQHLCMQQPWRY